jgi:CheY-like chemotaxis protein
MSGAAAQADSFFYVLQDAIRILFVDDDPILREFATVHLSSDHADVALAADGQQALDMLAKEPFDLVLLDLEMPRMDGFEALERLRRDERTRALPIIVVTGREDVGAIDRAFQSGATSFLVKPINWRLLTYQIRYVYRAHRMELSLSSAEAQERARGREAAQALHRLAKEGAGLIQAAMTGGADLHRAALSYADLLAEVTAQACDTEASPP